MAKTDKHSTAKKGSLLPWATAIMLVTGVAVLAAIYWNKNVTVNNVVFSGNELIETEQLLRAADVPFGINPDSLDISIIAERIEQIDYVKDAILYIEPSGDLNINIVERAPLAVLIEGQHKIYVDEEGVKLPILQGKAFNLPIVYGFEASDTRDTLSSTAFRQISRFLSNAKEHGFGWATISEVAYNNEHGVVALSHENGVKLLFGNNEFKTKLENWEAFYVEVIRTKGIRAMQQVDLRFTNQVVTKEI